MKGCEYHGSYTVELCGADWAVVLLLMKHEIGNQAFYAGPDMEEAVAKLQEMMGSMMEQIKPQMDGHVETVKKEVTSLSLAEALGRLANYPPEDVRLHGTGIFIRKSKHSPSELCDCPRPDNFFGNSFHCAAYAMRRKK